MLGGFCFLCSPLPGSREQGFTDKDEQTIASVASPTHPLPSILVSGRKTQWPTGVRVRLAKGASMVSQNPSELVKGLLAVVAGEAAAPLLAAVGHPLV